MALKLTLNGKNDQLVPIESLKKWSSEYLDKKQEANIFQKLFTGKEGKVKRERIGEINNVIKNLKPKGANRAWFLKIFLKPWNGEITDEAKLIFEALSDAKAFRRLESEAEAFENKLSEALNEAGKAVADLTNKINPEKAAEPGNLSAATKNFAVEFNKYNAKSKEAPNPAPEAAPTAPKLIDRKKSQDALNKAFAAKKNVPVAKSEWMQQLLTDLQTGETPATPGGGGPAPVAESVVNRYGLNKKLYEAGLIDRSEYLASLLEVRNQLEEKSSAARKARRAADPVVQARAAQHAAARAGAASPGGSAPQPQAAATPAAPAAETPATSGAPTEAAPAAEAATPTEAAPAAEATTTPPQPQETEEQLQNQLTTTHGLTKNVVDAEWERLSKDPANGTKIAKAAPAQPVTDKAIHDTLIAVQQAEKNKRDDQKKILNLFKFIGFVNDDNKKTWKDVTDLMQTVAKDPAKKDSFKPIYNELLGDLISFDDFAARTLNESFKSMKLTKKLYKAGFVDRSEYLAVLVKTKKLLSEAEAAPTPAPTPTTENPAIKTIGAAISSLEDPQTGALTALFIECSALQQGLVDMSKKKVSESTLSSKEEQLVKLFYKKQVLLEYQKTGKVQLNEFFFLAALLFAALAGAIAWAAGKLTDFFKDSHTGHSSSHPSSHGDSQKNVGDLLQTIGVGVDGNGDLVDGSGKRVEEFATQKETYIVSLTGPLDNIKKSVQEINQNVASITPAAYDAENGQLLKDTNVYKGFVGAFAASPETEITRIKAALDNIQKSL